MDSVMDAHLKGTTTVWAPGLVVWVLVLSGHAALSLVADPTCCSVHPELARAYCATQ